MMGQPFKLPNDNNKHRVAHGVPTRIDTDKLDRALGVPDVGDVITYDAIEEIIGHRRNSYRFKTVQHAWRKKLSRDHNVEMVAIPGEGLEVADPTTRVNVGAGKIKQAYRSTRRAGEMLGRTDASQLDEAHRRKQTHLLNLSATITGAFQTHAKALPPIPKPTKR